MNYLLFCCFDEARWQALPQAQQDSVITAYHGLVDDLVHQGCYRFGGRLAPTTAATTVRERQGKPVLTDGPFAETKEQLGGFHVIDCRDLDEALAIARRIPTLPVGGTIEVRPLSMVRDPADGADRDRATERGAARTARSAGAASHANPAAVPAAD